MRKIYSSLLMLAMMMVSMVAKAQESTKLSDLTIVNSTDFVLTLNYYEGDQYEGAQASITLDGLYDLLGTTAAEYDATAAVLTETVGEDGLTGELVAPGDAGTDGWYGRFAGVDISVPRSWGSQIVVDGDTLMANTFYLQQVSLADGVLTIGSQGQYPGVMKVGDNDYTYLYIVNSTKAVRVKVVAEVVARPEIEEPVTSLASLNIVKEYTGTVNFYLGKQYESKTAEIDLSDIYDVLGVSAASLDANIAKVTLTVAIDTIKPENEGGEKGWQLGDRLVVPEVATGGAWFGRYSNYDEATGNSVPITPNAPMTHGSNDGVNTVYTQSIKLTDGLFTFVTGQYPGRVLTEDDKVVLYIVNGTKAAKVTIGFVLEDEPTISFDEWEKVSEQTVEIEHFIGGAGGSFTVDLEAVAAALGCETGDVTFNVLKDESSLSNDHTANHGGNWMNKEGYSWSWGTEGYAIYAEPNTDQEYTRWNYGFNDAPWEIGDESFIKLYFSFGGKYHLVIMHVKIIEKPEVTDNPDDKFDLVATIPFVMQMVPGDNYYAGCDEETKRQMEKDIDIEYVKSLIGEGTYEFYGLEAPSKPGSYGALVTGNGYTPNSGFDGGFWMGMPLEELGEEYQYTVYPKGWGNNSFGIEWSYDRGIIGFDQYPGIRSVGDNFISTFYWVNTDNNKAIKYVINVVYVSELTEQTEVVAAEGSTVAVTQDLTDKDGFYSIKIDTESIYNALGLTDELLEAASFYTLQSALLFNSIQPEDDVLFGLDGYTASEENAVCSAHLLIEDGLTIVVDPWDVVFEEGDESILKITIAIDYDGKRALYTLTLVSKGSPLAINAQNLQKAAPAGIYSISGARLATPQKGLNIIRKADGSVSKVFVK